MASDLAAPAISPALEREYNLRIRHPERDVVYRGFTERSAAFRARAHGRLDLRYASGPRCLLDYFPGMRPDAPLFVFIHGGYWRALDKNTFTFLAEPYVAAGAAVALLGYDLAPAVTLTAIVQEIESAMVWLAERAGDLGFARDRVVVSGHSAGGHLAGLLGAAPPERIGRLDLAGVVGLSGVFDLEPLRETSVNVDVRMTADEARLLSPMRATSFPVRRFIAAVGGLETEGFLDQSRRFAAHVAGCGATVELMIVPGRTHFDLLDELALRGTPLFEATRALLGL